MEPVPLRDGRDRNLTVRRLDCDHPRSGESQRDCREALLLQIGQGPRYARTVSPLGRHVGSILTAHADVVITQKGDSPRTGRSRRDRQSGDDLPGSEERERDLPELGYLCDRLADDGPAATVRLLPPHRAGEGAEPADVALGSRQTPAERSYRGKSRWVTYCSTSTPVAAAPFGPARWYVVAPSL